MSEPVQPQRKPVALTVAFEPTRLAAEALRGAYRALVPAPAKQIARPPECAAGATLRRVEGSER
jgi:hypothetical protein